MWQQPKQHPVIRDSQPVRELDTLKRQHGCADTVGLHLRLNKRTDELRPLGGRLTKRKKTYYKGFLTKVKRISTAMNRLAIDGGILFSLTGLPLRAQPSAEIQLYLS